jgi:hypothetical protein
MPFENAVKSTETPFVYFVSGIPVYPPNKIYECLSAALGASGEKPLVEVLKEYARGGDVGGSWTVLPEGWWYHFLLTYLTHFRNNFAEPEELEESAIKALNMMAKRPPEAVWSDLVAYVISDIDKLSGWTKSWIKDSSERKNVFKGEGGNYYCKDLDGTLIKIVGAKTTPETRLDFITDQVLRKSGCLRQIFETFAAFAIAHEFECDPSQFPRSMKAVLVEPKFRATSHHWRLMQYERTRSICWRPLSNFCDPDWLSGDLLARITDTLDRNLWQEKIEKQKNEPNSLDEGCAWQIDYVLDSAVAIGKNEEIYFPFEGRTFRWINGTAETKATISIGVKNLNEHRTEDESLNRLLSLLVWEHRQSIVKESGVGGARRPIPHIWGPRMSFGVQIDPQFLFPNSEHYSGRRWLALALFKEGFNAASVFYQFLNFWKIIEVAIKERNGRRDWINAKAVQLRRDRIQEILKKNANAAEYLDYSGRCAIAHVFNDPVVNPDDYDDFVRISQDVDVVEELARAAVEEFLPT